MRLIAPKSRGLKENNISYSSPLHICVHVHLTSRLFNLQSRDKSLPSPSEISIAEVTNFEAYVSGNLAVGNERKLLVDTVYLCLPFIGFPRALNAMAAINELIPQ